MLKKIKTGFCILAISLFALASNVCAEPWPNFHNGNTLVKGKLHITDVLEVDSITTSVGQTRMFTLLPGDMLAVNADSAVRTLTIGGTGNVWQVLQFDADGGSTGDDFVRFAWVVPDGYIVDSGRMNVFWSCESAETALDTATFDMTVLAVTPTETVDATPTAFTAVSDITWAGAADQVYSTQLNFEVVAIAVDDIVYFDFWVDESASMFADTLDIHAIQIEYESTE